MHTRFEHSLGVMHTATLLYDAIVRNSAEILKAELAYTTAGLERDRQLVRFAALLHDVGHSPFSHGSEELFPKQDSGAMFAHEDYSVAIIRSELRQAIEDHELNANYGFHADEIAALLEGTSNAKQRVFWRDLLTGQMDADRMDYLLRDAAEGLVLARYFMFTQVYFHKTRVAYDVHLREAMKELLSKRCLPRPIGGGLKRFLEWDDWRVLGLLASGKGGEHGKRLATRDHYRLIYRTPEVSVEADLELVETVKVKLGGLVAAEGLASKSWYKTGRPDIPVVDAIVPKTVKPLSKYSNVVANLRANNQVFLYARPENVSKANEIVGGVMENDGKWQIFVKHD